MTPPLPFSIVARSTWHDFRRAWGRLLVFQGLFKLIEAWLFVPAVAVILSLLLARTGQVALSNRDILDFLLSPIGLLYAAVFGSVAVALLLLEQAGLMILVAPTDSDSRPAFRQALLDAFAKAWRVAELGTVKMLLLAVTFVPFVLLGVLTYGLLLSRHDINYYLEDRPPAFWLAAGLGGLLLLGAGTTGAWLYVRWSLALPIVLFESRFGRAALRASTERVRDVGWRVGFLLLGWQVANLLLGAGLVAGFRLVAAVALDRAGEYPIALILLLLVVRGGLLAALSFVTVVGQALLTRQVYLHLGERAGLLPLDGSDPTPDAPMPSPWSRRLAWVSIGIVLVMPLVLWADLPGHLEGRPLVQVTAHRGYSRAAPENTLAAIRKAIDCGADFAEVDVQLTSDGVVVLLHDSDLKRVAGVPGPIGDLTLAEVRKLDVGRWFGSAFAGERLPTLEEVITLARERIKLNIELKVSGSDRRLARETAKVVRKMQFESECIVTSFDYEALLEAKRHDSDLQTGLIVARGLGDVTGLDVEILSVHADGLADEVLRAAHRRGKGVHVWTVNDARQMTQLMKRGVDNIITDEPALLIRVRNEWASLTGPERLVLASRLLLGLAP